MNYQITLHWAVYVYAEVEVWCTVTVTFTNNRASDAKRNNKYHLIFKLTYSSNEEYIFNCAQWSALKEDSNKEKLWFNYSN